MVYSILNFLNKHTLFKYNFPGPYIKRHRTSISLLAVYFLQIVSAKESFFFAEEVIRASCFRQAVFTMAFLAVSNLAGVRVEFFFPDFTGHCVTFSVSLCLLCRFAWPAGLYAL